MSNIQRNKSITPMLAAIWCLALSTLPLNAADAAVERARKQMRMLDDLYKTVVVLITTHYVNEESTLPAGSAAIALFAAMKEKPRQRNLWVSCDSRGLPSA